MQDSMQSIVWHHFSHRNPNSDHTVQVHNVGVTIELSIDGCLSEESSLILLQCIGVQFLHSNFPGPFRRLPDTFVYSSKLARSKV